MKLLRGSGQVLLQAERVGGVERVEEIRVAPIDAIDVLGALSKSGNRIGGSLLRRVET